MQHLHNFMLPSWLTLRPGGSCRGFDPTTGQLALLFVEPTGSMDWSGGDPKTVWLVEIPTRLDLNSELSPKARKVPVANAAQECTSDEAETRLYSPTLSYVRWHEVPSMLLV